MAGKREPLEVARARFLARTAKLLDDELDVTDPAESLRRMGPLLARFRTAARREALDVVQGRASAAIAEALGTDLGWDAVNADRWLGRDAQARYALRLVQVADDLKAKVKAGKDPAELAAWVRYWQIQVAGSDVHEVARRATLDTAAQLPTGGRVMRIAEPRACDWCLTQASRGAVFHSEATALATSHGHCRCDLVLVADPDAIRQTIDDGRIAWAESGMAAKDFPLASRAKAASVPDAAWQPGSGTPERLMSARLQLQQVDDVISRSRPLAEAGDEQAKKVLAWNEKRAQALKTELGIGESGRGEVALPMQRGPFPVAGERPSYEGLMIEGSVAPGSDPRRYFSASEDRVADAVEREFGLSLRSVPERDPWFTAFRKLKAPDAVDDAARRTVELKVTSSIAGIEGQLRHAFSQSDNVFIAVISKDGPVSASDAAAMRDRLLDKPRWRNSTLEVLEILVEDFNGLLVRVP